MIISNSENGTEDIISVYLIFDQKIENNITAKIFDENNQKYGRVSQIIKGNKEEAKYIEFEFDKRTNISGKGKITFE